MLVYDAVVLQVSGASVLYLRGCAHALASFISAESRPLSHLLWLKGGPYAYIPHPTQTIPLIPILPLRSFAAVRGAGIRSHVPHGMPHGLPLRRELGPGRRRGEEQSGCAERCGAHFQWCESSDGSRRQGLDRHSPASAALR